MPRLLDLALVICLLLLAAASVHAQEEWVPGSSYDPGVPTIADVLGFKPPAMFTSFYETEKLLHAWAAASDRARLITYGEDYEGKKLYMLVVSSPGNLAELDRHVASLGRLADPRTLAEGELDGIIRSTPAAVMISTIDTSEASSVEAMQIVAYQLLAGTDERTRSIVDNTLTYIIPVENPSPRERYVAWYRSVRSNIPKADPNAAEHHEPWGIGNDANHYQLDPNRDMVPLRMREGRAKVRLIREWHPELALDIHEMGVNSTFFFPPYPPPYNRNLPTEDLHRWWEIYADDMRNQFDKRGWRYFSGDSFGSPFLGMHTLYTQYHGMIGILFEQGGGGGGLVIERDNGFLLTLRDRVQHHVTGMMSYLDTTVQRREDLHRYFYEFFRSSMNGVPGFRQQQYVFLPGDDPNKIGQFVDSLLAHGIEVQRSTEPFSARGANGYFSDEPENVRFPAGSYIVSLRQPLSRLANAILEKEPYHSIPVFYDISVWALPYQYGIEGYWMDDVSDVAAVPVTEPIARDGRLVGDTAASAYAWAYDGALAAAAAYALAAEGYRLYLHPGPFAVGGMHFAKPAFVVPVAENEESLHARVRALVQERPIGIFALDSGYASEGSDLGSGVLEPIARPSVAILTREGTDTTAWGSFYFFFDEMYRIPFTPITIDQLRNADLRRYSTIIIPDGGQRSSRRGLSGKPYTWYFREEGTQALESWIRQGGTLITVKGGTGYASASGSGFTSVESLGATKQTPGAIVRVEVNGASPLTIGYPDSFHVLSRNTQLFRSGENSRAVLSYADAADLKVAGYLLPGDAEKIAASDYLMTESLGRGRVIMFAGDPNLRNQWTHLHQLLFNAILFGSMVR